MTGRETVYRKTHIRGYFEKNVSSDILYRFGSFILNLLNPTGHVMH